MSAIRYRVPAPSALGDDLRRFLSLTWTLAATDFKLRFFGSALGYLWSLARPLMTFGVLYVVFQKVFKAGKNIENYPAYLLTSIVLWTYFLETTGACVTSLVNRENLLRKIRFPRLVVPFSVALSSLFNLGLNLLAVLAFVLLAGVTPRLSWLELPLLVLVLVFFATGVGMLLAALYVRFRDVSHIWDVVSIVLFYGSPVLYVVELIPPEIRHFEMANPIALVTTQMRHAFLDPSAPSAASAFGSASPFLSLGVVALLFALGYRVFAREAPRIAENL